MNEYQYNKLPSLISEQEANSLAKFLFKRYDRNKSGFLEDNEIELFIRDVPRILNKAPQGLGNYDVEGMKRVLDTNKDGVVCKNDFVNYAMRYFV